MYLIINKNVLELIKNIVYWRIVLNGVNYKKNKWIFVIIPLAIVFCFVIGLLLLGFSRGRRGLVSNLSGDIAVLPVQGELSASSGSLFSSNSYNHSWTLDQIDSLMNKPNNKGLILVVNSPGGGVYESDQLYLKLKEYKEVTKRPIYVYMSQMAASGGYYISMAADKIYANRMTTTGSIGVIMSVTDTTEFQKKIGIKTEYIVSGKNKAMGNPLTSEQREILQSMIDETYDIFISLVSEGRKMNLEKVKKLADGRIYTAKQAKEAGLIDEIGDFDDVIEDFKKTYNLENSNVIVLTEETGFFSGFKSILLNVFSKDKELDTLMSLINNNHNGKLMYYYDPNIY